MRVQVKDFMTAPVKTLLVDSRVEDLRTLMEEQQIHAVPVTGIEKQLPANKLTVQGIVTASDLTHNVDGETPIRDIMTQRVHVIHKDSSARAAARLMLKHKVHHLVVMHDGDIVGMVSSTDFVELVANHALESV